MGACIEAVYQRTERGRREWIEGTLEQAAALKEARSRFPDDLQFSRWLAESDLDHASRDDRDALVGMGEDLETARIVLEELPERWSWANIWRCRPNGRMPAGIDIRRKSYFDLVKKLSVDQQKHELQLLVHEAEQTGRVVDDVASS